MSGPLMVNLETARALELAEAATSREFCAAAARLYPTNPIKSVACAGGIAKSYGPSDPLNAVKGVGLSGPVAEDEWKRVEAMYAETSSPVVVDLCPLADEGFVAMLSARGYVIGSFETVMTRRLGEGQGISEHAPAPGVEIVVVREGEADVWTRVLDVGFASGGEPVRLSVDIGKVRLSVPNSVMLLALVEGVPAGGAGLSVHEGVALMSGAAVLPGFRGRGIQLALTTERLRIGALRGCRLAKMDVRAASASYRNAVRAGFQVAYTRPQLVRKWA